MLDLTSTKSIVQQIDYAPNSEPFRKWQHNVLLREIKKNPAMFYRWFVGRLVFIRTGDAALDRFYLQVVIPAAREYGVIKHIKFTLSHLPYADSLVRRRALPIEFDTRTSIDYNVDKGHLQDFFRSEYAQDLVGVDKIPFNKLEEAVRKWDRAALTRAKRKVLDNPGTVTVVLQSIDHSNPWSIVRLEDQAAYNYEALRMAHCVDGYWGMPTRRIYSLRDGKNRPLMTCDMAIRIGDNNNPLYVQSLQMFANQGMTWEAYRLFNSLTEIFFQNWQAHAACVRWLRRYC